MILNTINWKELTISSKSIQREMGPWRRRNAPKLVPRIASVWAFSSIGPNLDVGLSMIWRLLRKSRIQHMWAILRPQATNWRKTNQLNPFALSWNKKSKIMKYMVNTHTCKIQFEFFQFHILFHDLMMICSTIKIECVHYIFGLPFFSFFFNFFFAFSSLIERKKRRTKLTNVNLNDGKIEQINGIETLILSLIYC